MNAIKKCIYFLHTNLTMLVEKDKRYCTHFQRRQQFSGDLVAILMRSIGRLSPDLFFFHETKNTKHRIFHIAVWHCKSCSRSLRSYINQVVFETEDEHIDGVI